MVSDSVSVVRLPTLVRAAPDPLGLYLHAGRNDHTELLNYALFACHDSSCCRRGLRDMIEDPARHFLIQRMKQVSGLGRIPVSIRAERFLENQVRPATDSLVHATNLHIKDESLVEKLRMHRKRLDAVRVSLAALARQGEDSKRAAAPKTRMAREPRASA